MADAIVRVVDGRATVRFSGPEGIATMLAQAQAAAVAAEQFAASAGDAAEVVGGKLDVDGDNLGGNAPALRLALSLNEVSPLDYGAVGNGIDADDLPIALAIAAAVATGRSVNLRGLAYGVSAPVALESVTCL